MRERGRKREEERDRDEEGGTNDCEGTDEAAFFEFDMERQAIVVGDVEDFLQSALELEGEGHFHIA